MCQGFGSTICAAFSKTSSPFEARERRVKCDLQDVGFKTGFDFFVGTFAVNRICMYVAEGAKVENLAKLRNICASHCTFVWLNSYKIVSNPNIIHTCWHFFFFGFFFLNSLPLCIVRSACMC